MANDQLKFNSENRIDMIFQTNKNLAAEIYNVQNRQKLPSALAPRPRHFMLQAPPPFRLAASVLWCWSCEKEGRAVEVVLAFRLYIGSFVFHVHSYQDRFKSPDGPSVFYI